MTPPNMSDLRGLLRLLASIPGRRGMGVAIILILLAGATDGVGLALLVPLLELLGADGGGGPLDRIVSGGLAAIGLPLALPGLLGVFLVVVVVRSVLVRAREVALTEVRFTLVGTLSVRLYRAIALASWPFLARTRGTDLSSALLSEIDRVGQGSYFALQFLPRVLTILVHLTVAFALAPAFSAAALAAGVVLAWTVRGRMIQSLRLGRMLNETNRALLGEVSEFLGAVKVAKSHGAEDRHIAAFAGRIEKSRAAQMDFARSSAEARLIQEVAGACAAALLLWVGATIVQLPIARLLLLALIFQRLLPMAQEIQRAAQQVLHMLPALASVLDTCRTCEANAEPQSESTDPPPRLTRELRVEDVWFTHPGTDIPVLRGAGLVLASGSLTVLYGPSGVGKSTLLDLLAGLVQPDRGRVLLDGRPLSTLSSRAWRQTLSYVPQESVLFHDTIRANLLWARPDAGEDELRNCLERAAAGFVLALPQGMETVVGDRGLRLSGGERQRLALARALLRAPSLLILDEATAALDAETERQVFEAVGRLRGTTTLVVTHRPAAVPSPDQMLAMVDGKIEATRFHGIDMQDPQ